MKRHFTVMTVIAGLALAAGCGRQSQQAEDPAEAAFKEFRTAYLNVEQRADQVALVEQFLTDFPNSEYAGYFGEDVINYYARDLGQPEKAYEILDGVLAVAEDPEVRFNIGTELVPVASKIGRPVDLTALVADLEAQGELDFHQTQQVMKAAAETGDWELEETYADGALARATAEAYRGEYPDREFTDDEVAERVARRRVTALAHKGWAAFNQGRADEAMALFEEADGLAQRNYVGLTGGPLATYWGTALWQHGDMEGAIRMLAPEVVFGDKEHAEPILRKAYGTANSGEEGYEEFTVFTRRHLARQVDDFTLTNYQDDQVSLGDLRKDKVTLLAFWFPT